MIVATEEDPDGFYRTFLSLQLVPNIALHIDVEQVAPLDVVWQKQLAKQTSKESEENDESDESDKSEQSNESEENNDKPKFTNWTKRQKKEFEQMGGTHDRRQKKLHTQQQRNKARRRKNHAYDD